MDSRKGVPNNCTFSWPVEHCLKWFSKGQEFCFYINQNLTHILGGTDFRPDTFLFSIKPPWMRTWPAQPGERFVNFHGRGECLVDFAGRGPGRPWPANVK